MWALPITPGMRQSVLGRQVVFALKGENPISTGPDGRTNAFEADLEKWRAQAERIILGQAITRPIELGRRFHVLQEVARIQGAIRLLPQAMEEIRRTHPDQPAGAYRRPAGDLPVQL